MEKGKLPWARPTAARYSGCLVDPKPYVLTSCLAACAGCSSEVGCEENRFGVSAALGTGAGVSCLGCVGRASKSAHLASSFGERPSRRHPYRPSHGLACTELHVGIDVAGEMLSEFYIQFFGRSRVAQRCGQRLVLALFYPASESRSLSISVQVVQP
jgi:hypothetical protein